MSGSSLREGFLIDSRRLQAFSRTWEKKGSSVRERALVCLWRKLASHVSHCVLLRRTTEAFHATEEMAFPYNSCDPGRRGTCSQPGSRPRPRHSSSLLESPGTSGRHLCFTIRCWILLPRTCSSLELQQHLNGGVLPSVSSIKCSALL